MVKGKSIQKGKKRKVFLKRSLMRGVMMTGSYVAGRGLDSGYQMLTGETAPRDPEKNTGGWKRAILWAAIAGALLGASKAAIRPALRRSIDKIIPE